MKNKEIFLFIVFPLLINLLLIGLYFSGVKLLQQIVAPDIPRLHRDSWREMGVLEQLQNIYLLSILGLLVACCIIRRCSLEKLFFTSGVFFVLFILLEEIDYGLHYYEFFANELTEFEVRNWHNEKTGGKQNVRYLKKIADIAMGLWFAVLPFCKSRIKNTLAASLIPSRWFAATFIITIAMSNFGHYLEDQNLGMIDGVQGNLAGNVSEFREASNYYMWLLYAMQLFRMRIDHKPLGFRQQ